MTAEKLINEKREWLYNANGEGFWALKDWHVAAIIAQLIPEGSVAVKARAELTRGDIAKWAEQVYQLPEHWVERRDGEIIKQLGAFANLVLDSVFAPDAAPDPLPKAGEQIAAEPKCKTCSDTKEVHVGDSENYHASENVEPCPDCCCESCDGTGIAETGIPSADGESITYVQRPCPACATPSSAKPECCGEPDGTGVCCIDAQANAKADRTPSSVEGRKLEAYAPCRKSFASVLSEDYCTNPLSDEDVCGHPRSSHEVATPGTEKKGEINEQSTD